MVDDNMNNALAQLRRIRLFEPLPEDALEEISNTLKWQEFPSDHLLIDGSASRPHGVFILTEGEVQVFRKNSRGHEVELARKPSVDIFGEIGALSGIPGSACVATTQQSLVAELPASHFVDLSCRFPKLAIGVLSRISENVRQLDAEVERLNLAEHLLEQLFRKTSPLL
jgi:CRP-like cAMP-binding protein